MTPLDRLHEGFNLGESGLSGPVIEAAGMMKVLAPEVYQHGIAVGALSGLISTRLGCDDLVVAQAEVAGLLHDFGKILDVDVLALTRAPRNLTDVERIRLRLHPAMGAKFLSGKGIERVVTDAILKHHEGLDGSGYYKFVAGRVGLLPRILAVADNVHALTSKNGRGYRSDTYSRDSVLQVLRGGVGTRFDSSVVEAFEQVSVSASVF